MNLTDSIRRSLLGLCFGLSALGAACSRPAPAPDPTVIAGPISVVSSFSYGDRSGSVSRVVRAVAADGGETLHGETEIGAGAAPERVVEDVTIDARGQLVRAEIAVAGGCGQPADKTVTLDRAAGTVTVATAAGAVTWTVPAGDSPWIYAPIADGAGRSASTPIAAWVALRAASASPLVRLVDEGSRQSARVPADQVAFRTESGTTVALGDDGIDAGGEFIDELRLHAAGVTLGRIDDAAAREVACDRSGLAPGNL